MQKCLRVIGVIAVCLFGMTAVGYASSGEDVIDKVRINSIKKIEIKDGNVMDVTIEFKNANDKKVKFVNGKDFIFSIGSWKKEGGKFYEDVEKDPLKSFGTTKFEGKEQEKGPLLENTNTEVTFNVKMGDDPKALEALKHLLNCIGDTQNKQPYFDIKGSFELGIYSEKGWTFGRDVGIEWRFIPCIQNQVDFMPGTGEGCSSKKK